VSVSSRSLFFLTNSTPWLLLQLSSNPLYCSISKIPRLLRLGTHPQFLPAKMVIHRVTMFKVKDTSNIPTMLEQYKILNSNAVRVSLNPSPPRLRLSSQTTTQAEFIPCNLERQTLHPRYLRWRRRPRLTLSRLELRRQEPVRDQGGHGFLRQRLRGAY
jgi:hypothetical protein